MTTQERIDQFRKMIKNANSRLARARGCDGRSEIRRRELQSHIDVLESGLEMYLDFRRNEKLTR